MATHIVILWALLGSRLNQSLKRWTKPTTASLAARTLADMTRSRKDLVAENALLRQQLIVLRRQVKRPQLTNRDRIRLVLFARLTRYWQNTLHIVQPDTLLRWHRDLFRLYWRRKSRKRERKRRIPQGTIDLIKEMAGANRLWGAERIRGELLKLGIKVSKRTVQRYMPKHGRNSGQTWATFLKNHAAGIWACDFTVVHDLLFRPLYIFVIIELKTRRIVHAIVTRKPTDDWTAQQLREATPWGKGPRYLIRDRDKKYGALFSAVARSTVIKELKTPVQASRANAVCERFIGSLKRECLDHMFILNRQQLQRTVSEYVDFYNHLRPHQGLWQHIPDPVDPIFQPVADRDSTKITSTAILGGLHDSYSRFPNCTDCLDIANKRDRLPEVAHLRDRFLRCPAPASQLLHRLPCQSIHCRYATKKNRCQSGQMKVGLLEEPGGASWISKVASTVPIKRETRSKVTMPATLNLLNCENIESSAVRQKLVASTVTRKRPLIIHFGPLRWA